MDTSPERAHGGEAARLSEEPIDVGWYAYSGGAQMMVFHLSETGQWSVHHANGSADDCVWAYIEQALGVWDLVLLTPSRRPADEDGLRSDIEALADEMERGGYGTAHLRLRALLAAHPAPPATVVEEAER